MRVVHAAERSRECVPRTIVSGGARAASPLLSGRILLCGRRLIKPSLRTCAGSAEFCRQNETQVSAARYSAAADQTDNQIKTYISQRTDE